jgi:hypothetical protein
MACNAKLVHLLPDVIARTNVQLASSPTHDAKGGTLPQGAIEWHWQGDANKVAVENARRGAASDGRPLYSSPELNCV